MAPARYLVDSVIIIDHLNGVAAATRWLEARKPGELVISVITRAEVLAGTSDADRPQVAAMLDEFACLPLDTDAATEAAALRRSSHLRLPDAFQAALALIHGLSLVTRNTKDFPPGTQATVVVPYRI